MNCGTSEQTEVLEYNGIIDMGNCFVAGSALPGFLYYLTPGKFRPLSRRKFARGALISFSLSGPFDILAVSLIVMQIPLRLRRATLRFAYAQVSKTRVLCGMTRGIYPHRCLPPSKRSRIDMRWQYCKKTKTFAATELK